MTLVEVCEPVFQYVCTLNRLGRAGGSVSAALVKEEAREAFRQAEQRARTLGLSASFDAVRLPLACGVDGLIREGAAASRWSNEFRGLAEDLGEQAPDDRFFEALNAAMREPSGASTDRLAVFYMVLGLGYRGGRDPADLRVKMREIAARARGMTEADTTGRVCPEAYESVDTRALTQPPARSLVGMVIALITMVAVLAGAYVYLYREQTRDLADSLRRVTGERSVSSAEQDPAAGGGEP
ncbi:MAG: DotU family type IV/VI secretion system protein [Phycisphaeraceae bacterium]|nr:MAG: DotU family type IV/VI secretion system protein [Phycisphaeraceae bacterium]